VNGTSNMMHMSLKHDIKNFVFASSAAVYAIPIRLPISEDDLSLATSTYDISKLKGKQIVSSFRNKLSNAVSLRFFNISRDSASRP